MNDKYIDDLIDFLLNEGSFKDICARCANLIQNTREELLQADKDGIVLPFCKKTLPNGDLPEFCVCREGMKEWYKEHTKE